MFVTPEFYVMFVYDSPVCGRVYEDDLEYNEETEKGMDEEEEGEDFVPAPPPPLSQSHSRQLQQGGIAGIVAKTSSPILSAAGGRSKFTYYNIHGGTVVKETLETPLLTASKGSVNVIKSREQAGPVLIQDTCNCCHHKKFIHTLFCIVNEQLFSNLITLYFIFSSC